MKIAVIGGGLAGLSAAWALCRAGAQTGPRRDGSDLPEVTLFERQPSPGFTAASVTLDGPDFARFAAARVDVPLRVFYPGYYPTLMRLYAALGVASEPVSYASSFVDGRGQVYFRYRNLRWGSRSWSVVAPQDLLSPQRRAIALEALRFHRVVRQAVQAHALDGVTVEAFATREALAPVFVEGLLLPAICTICTCPTAIARRMPMSAVAGYLLRGLSRDAVRRACGGAHEVQKRLLAGIGRLRCGEAIAAVWREGERVKLRTGSGAEQAFDHVVFATTAPHARRMLADARGGEQAALAGFATTPVEVLTHRDASLLPAQRAQWSSVTLRVDTEREAPESTIWINAVQPALRGAPDVFQTVSPHRPPRDDLVLGRARFERPVVDERSEQALRALQRLHQEPDRRIWFCGAWAQPGVPLLESAVGSALEVARRLGAPALPG